MHRCSSVSGRPRRSPAASGRTARSPSRRTARPRATSSPRRSTPRGAWARRSSTSRSCPCRSRMYSSLSPAARCASERLAHRGRLSRAARRGAHVAPSDPPLSVELHRSDLLARPAPRGVGADGPGVLGRRRRTGHGCVRVALGDYRHHALHLRRLRDVHVALVAPLGTGHIAPARADDRVARGGVPDTGQPSGAPVRADAHEHRVDGLPARGHGDRGVAAVRRRPAARGGPPPVPRRARGAGRDVRHGIAVRRRGPPLRRDQPDRAVRSRRALTAVRDHVPDRHASRLGAGDVHRDAAHLHRGRHPRRAPSRREPDRPPARGRGPPRPVGRVRRDRRRRVRRPRAQRAPHRDARALLMEEVRAALAIAQRDIRQFSRYRFVIAAQIFTPLYQGVLPALLFGASFAVSGRVVGLEKTIGTDDLAGFIFLGGVISGLVATAFWAMGMSFRNEMETGTLEPTWVTPTSRSTLVIGRAMGGLVWFLFSQVALFAIGIVFFGLRLRWEMVYAMPALVLATIALVGIAHLLAGIVLTIRDANLFIDCTNFLFATASGAAFPVTLLPGVLQPLAFLLPTTYAMDILRQHALGTPPLIDPVLEYGGLILTTIVMFPVGRWAFARAERRMRIRGTLGQY